MPLFILALKEDEPNRQQTNEWMAEQADEMKAMMMEKQASSPQLNELLCIVAVHIFSAFFLANGF